MYIGTPGLPGALGPKGNWYIELKGYDSNK